MDFFGRFFDTNGFMPHGMCLLWRPEVFWLHAISDSLIALAYYSIPIALIYFVRRRKDIVFPWVFYMFGAFILACGTTHVMGVWTLWNPDYPLDGLIKVATAGLSVGTAIALWPLMPRALALASPAQLESINNDLRREIAERQHAEAEARRLNEELETRVREQTASLRQANERLTAEVAERRKSDELLRAITENTSAVIYVKDLDGRYVMINRRFCEIFHLDRESVIGKTDHDLFAKEAADAFRAMDTRVMRADQPLTEEELAPQDDGMHAYISLKAPLRDENGKARAVFGISTDITDLKRAEAALAESEDRSRLIIETALDAFVLMDEQGRIAEWNSQAEATFGWRADEAIGREVVETIIPPAARQAHREGLKRFLATGEERVLRRRIEISAQRRDGTEFPVELMIVPLQVAGAWVFSGFIRDLSERERSEQQLRQAQKMEAVGQLTGGLAHDFNNLLTVVISNLDLIERSADAGSRTKLLAEQAIAAALRGGELTQQLLAFARRQSLAARAIDVNDVARSTTELLRRTLGEHVSVELHLAENLHAAFADPTQVGTALANLAINARDAMPNGGALTIETANKHLDEAYAAEHIDVTPGDYVMLAVTDTGVGMPPEVLQHVFVPFFTTKPEGKGTGLGLSQVYGFAKQSGGHVKIYSEVGHGTTVRLYLPLAEANATVVEESASEEEQTAQLDGATILVVEDNADVRQTVVRQLTSLGYAPIVANDGESALEILRSDQTIDLLFTDVVMPHMSGYELAAAARELRPKLKVLFTSGFAEASPHNGRTGLLLSKPYRVSDLSRMVRVALANGAS